MKQQLIAALAALTMPVSAQASVTVLNFEGLGDEEAVADFYAPDFFFSPDALALIDSDAPGGSGGFANEPSANTILFFLDADNAILDAPNGFDTGFSFFYSSAVAATVTIYDGLGATGNILGSISLVAQFDDNCFGDPTGVFCRFSPAGISFQGIARSVDFSGAADLTGFDNLTFGSAVPVIPEPATWAMLIAGFGLVGGAMRRRSRMQAAHA